MDPSRKLRVILGTSEFARRNLKTDKPVMFEYRFQLYRAKQRFGLFIIVNVTGLCEAGTC